MINWKLIDRFWPVLDFGELKKVEEVEVRLRAKVFKNKGECKLCGKCCALISIPMDRTYMRDMIRSWKEWPTEGEKIPDNVQKQIKDFKFLLLNWKPVSRVDARVRGFINNINNRQFIYTCKLLTPKGRCPVHNKNKPDVCKGYPYYEMFGQESCSRKVFIGCGFADKRYKHGKRCKPGPQLKNSEEEVDEPDVEENEGNSEGVVADDNISAKTALGGNIS